MNGERAAGGPTRRTRDKHAAIRISLDQHAERVAKKQRTGEGGAIMKETAAQRLAALRARVLARCTAVENVRDSDERRSEDGQRGAEADGTEQVAEEINRGGSGADEAGFAGKVHPSDEAAEMPVAGVAADAGTASATRRNELPKIHLTECTDRICEPAWGGAGAAHERDVRGAACAMGSAMTGGELDAGVGGPRGRGAAVTATDVAASTTAWHSEGIAERPTNCLG